MPTLTTRPPGQCIRAALQRGGCGQQCERANDELVGDVLYQIGALEGIARASGGRVRYVKPHGAPPGSPR